MLSKQEIRLLTQSGSKYDIAPTPLYPEKTVTVLCSLNGCMWFEQVDSPDLLQVLYEENPIQRVQWLN